MPDTRDLMRKFLSDYGMLAVLLLLCLFFSLLTLKPQQPQGEAAAEQLSEGVQEKASAGELVLVVAGSQQASQETAQMVSRMLRERSFSRVREIVGTPRDLRVVLDQLRERGEGPAAIAITSDAVEWRVWEILPEAYPQFGQVALITPTVYYWPDFLKLSNLLAVVDRIVVIAIIAIGMTMVIVTAGIDLSVGSLIALSGVIGTLVMKQLGGLDAPAWTVAVGFLVGIVSCGLLGAFGGFLVARFKVAPFITTLALMMVARGLAFSITGGFSVYQVPEALPWLGQGRSLGIPNTVILLVVLYVVAHVFMSRTILGRYIYAVGGNVEAARLSGVPVAAVIVLVYVVSAVAAGVGGCIQASQLNAGTPNAGLMYELYVIAAVVVGGTSLSGGSGTIFGTLIGAFIISVVQNGMNLLGIESYTQNVVLGLVILAAVLLDKLRGGAPLAFLTGRGPAR
ncbi:MAG: ABC transporter permease [Acidobacteriota bacterium]